MVQFVLGQKGTGKTKYLIERIHEAVKQSGGNVVVIEKGTELRYDVDHSVRLINIEDYEIHDYGSFYGFISGLFAGNYDITDIFVDTTFKICGRDYAAFADMARKVDVLAERNSANICFTVSCELSDLPEDVHKYVVDR